MESIKERLSVILQNINEEMTKSKADIFILVGEKIFDAFIGMRVVQLEKNEDEKTRIKTLYKVEFEDMFNYVGFYWIKSKSIGDYDIIGQYIFHLENPYKHIILKYE